MAVFQLIKKKLQNSKRPVAIYNGNIIALGEVSAFKMDDSFQKGVADFVKQVTDFAKENKGLLKVTRDPQAIELVKRLRLTLTAYVMTVDTTLTLGHLYAIIALEKGHPSMNFDQAFSLLTTDRAFEPENPQKILVRSFEPENSEKIDEEDSKAQFVTACLSHAGGASFVSHAERASLAHQVFEAYYDKMKANNQGGPILLTQGALHATKIFLRNPFLARLTEDQKKENMFNVRCAKLKSSIS